MANAECQTANYGAKFAIRRSPFGISARAVVKTRAKFDQRGQNGSLAGVISPGQRLETNFPLKVFQDGAVREVPFGSLLTRRTIVSVYMRNNTPGCDRQMASLAKEAAAFIKAGYNVVAVSRDTGGSHQRY